MGRLPFEPDKMRGPEPLPSKPARRDEGRYGSLAEKDVITVSQAANLIRDTLEQRIASPLRVVGEVSNLKAARHWYFSLKDDRSVLSCVAWQSAAKKFGFTPADGDEVVVTGSISHYAPQGRTQFYVTGLKPVGAGALQVRFEQMCKELREKGYFDVDRKQPLPLLPRRIAVITSMDGAALQDVIDTARRRCPAVGLLVVDVRVQGEAAAPAVAKAITWVDHEHKRLSVDAILVTRGGGSMEDLWAFNERIVAEAAFKCSIPLVAAIGHESDTTVIELVADVRAATPTQAAMHLVPSRDELLAQVSHLDHHMRMLIRRRVERGIERLRHIALHPLFRDPHALIADSRDHINRLERDLHRTAATRLSASRVRLEQLAGRMEALRPRHLLESRRERLTTLAARLHRAARGHLRRSTDRLDAMERELAAVDPRNVLHRGYSYTTDSRRELVRSIADVAAGEKLITQVSDGSIDSIVGTAAARPRRRRAARQDDDQMDLFTRPT